MMRIIHYNGIIILFNITVTVLRGHAATGHGAMRSRDSSANWFSSRWARLIW